MRFLLALVVVEEDEEVEEELLVVELVVDDADVELLVVRHGPDEQLRMYQMSMAILVAKAKATSIKTRQKRRENTLLFIVSNRFGDVFGTFIQTGVMRMSTDDCSPH